VPLGMLALWCLHNLLVYGEPQILAQLARPYNRPAHAWRDNLCGLPVTLGSLLYLFPLLLAAALARRDRLVVFTTLGVCAGAWWASQRYLSGAGDWQFLLWSLGGCVLLVAVAIEGLRGARPLREAAAKDSAFLLAWLAAHVLFAVLFVPFQAVRNVLPALLPLTLLAFRALARGPQPAPGWLRPGLLLLLALQASVAGLVAAADYQFAAAYRDFAASAESRLAPLRTEAAAQGSSWFLGHWGWLHYAERAGLHKAQTIAPFPQAGELLVIPAYVDKGRVLALAPRLAQSLRKVEEVVIPGSLPLRTVHPAGAGFYAQFSRSRSGRPPSVPYRLLPGAPLEIFEVYRVAVPTTAPR